uniref:Chromosome 8 open reading frame 76 n=1 Tax=Latimeria chalumnae TaxID=7897 RepID=H3AMV2_LATCH
MEILGSEFDDSVFAKSREKTVAPLTSYNAKLCEPEWFCEEVTAEDVVEKLTAIKFRGDLAYRHQDFQKALDEYSSCLFLVPETNIAMRRDLQEGQARCLCHLGRHVEAMDIVQQLRSEATNADHLTAVLNLEITVFQSHGNVSQTISSFQQLLCLHPFNPWNWKKLAEVYMNLFQTLSATSKTTSGDTKHCNGFSKEFSTLTKTRQTEVNRHYQALDYRGPVNALISVENSSVRESNNQTVLEEVVALETKGKETVNGLWQKTCACFVRARLLFQLVRFQQTSFVLESNLDAQREIEEQLKLLQLREEALNLITEVMSEDLIPETLKEDGQGAETCEIALNVSTLTSIQSISESEFEEKWFKKLTVTFCTFLVLYYKELHVLT